jgi:uncharacterized protein YciI
MKSTVLTILILSGQCVFAQGLVFVFLHHRTDQAELPKEQVDKIMAGHMANMKKMAKDGKLLVAGPFDGGGGIFIFRSSSTDEVTQWLKDDPGVVAQRWKVETLPYQWRVGQPRLVADQFEMTNYQFVRFVPYIAKFNINDVPELFKKHDDYLKEIQKTGNIVAEGTFGDTEGGILIIKGDVNQSVLESDPAVHEGLLEIEIKKWFVAKGAFGEK